MTISWKTQALPALAASIGIAIVATAVSLFPFTPQYTAADLLPADRVIVYIENVLPEITEKLGPSIPTLQNLPSYRGVTAILVKLDDASYTWITFGPPEEGFIEPTIRSENPAAFDLLKTDAPALSNDAAFRSLSRTAAGSAPWIFLRSNTVPVLLPPAFPTPTADLAFTIDANTMNVAWIHHGPKSRQLVSGSKNILSHTLFSIQLNDLRGFSQMIAGKLQGERAIAFESILAGRLHDAFGDDISLTYDLLPLLENQTELQIGSQTESGDLVIVLEGRSDTAKKTLEKLHTSFRSQLISIEHVEETFDEKFTMDSLRIAGDAVTDTTEEKAGWTIRSTTNGIRGLHSAVNGVRFVLSTSRDSLMKSLATYPLPSTDNAVARGKIDADAFDAFINRYVPGEHLLPAFVTGPTNWALSTEGDLAVLRLSR